MKKAKRFLTGLLSAALALSLCAMPAMADEGEGNAQTPEIKTSVSTIDESKLVLSPSTNICRKMHKKRMMVLVKTVKMLRLVQRQLRA